MAHLRVVAFSDVYALDNLPRMASLVREARTGADRLVVALPGDFLAPSVLSSLDNGRGMVACLNAIGVTHVTFGNHEDDVPHRALVARMAELDAMWLASNVHFPDRALPDHDVITVGDVRVGMFGVVLSDPLMFRGVPFGATLDDPHAVAIAMLDRLLGDGCAYVLALTHQAIEADRDLAHDVRGRPVIILGSHEHTPFDEIVDDIRVLKAGADATRAIVVDLVFPGPSVTARLVPTAGYPEAADVRALVDRHLAPVRALSTATLVELAPGQTLSSVGMRKQQTSVGELVCSRLRDQLRTDACVFNAGGIRGNADYHGKFTYGDLENEVPFDNEVVTVAMPGSVLEAAIVGSRTKEHGGFLQVDDAVVLADNHVTSVANAPFDPARKYRVALVRELCFGLDHNEALIAYASTHPEEIPHAGGLHTPKELLVRSFALSLWTQLGGFAAIDTDGDGRVTRAEIIAALVREHHDAPELVGDLVANALDANQDGSVSPDECS